MYLHLLASREPFTSMTAAPPRGARTRVRPLRRSGWSAAPAVAWLALAVACAPRGAPPEAVQVAQGTLRSVNGAAAGTARIERRADGTVYLRAAVSGLPPGNHGAHIHTVGACDASGATPFASAGGHFNPTSRQHGRRNPAGPHAGDLPNLTVDASGRGQLEVPLQAALVATGAGTLFDDDGSALVIHANPDDELTDAGPAGPGNSGARIACGVITRM